MSFVFRFEFFSVVSPQCLKKNEKLTGVPESRIFIFESSDRASSAIFVFGFLRQWPSSKTTASQMEEEEEGPSLLPTAAAASSPCCFLFPLAPPALLPPRFSSLPLCRSIPYVVSSTPEPCGGPTAASAAALSAGEPEANSRASTPTMASSSALKKEDIFLARLTFFFLSGCKGERKIKN